MRTVFNHRHGAALTDELLGRRQDLLSRVRAGNGQAIAFAKHELRLEHWHSIDGGVLLGESSESCPLCHTK